MKHLGAILMAVIVCLFLDVIGAVFFATVPKAIHDPTATVSIVGQLIQDPMHTLQRAWTQNPFKYGQVVLLLFAAFLYFRMVKGKNSYEEAHEHGGQGTARWATKKDAFDKHFFARKQSKDILMRDVEESIEIQRQIEDEQEQQRNAEQQADEQDRAAEDQKKKNGEAAREVKQRLLRLKEMEAGRMKKIEKVANERPEEERQLYLEREMKLMDWRSLTVYQEGEYHRYLLKDANEEQLDRLIPYSLEYWEERKKQRLQKLRPRSGTLFAVVGGSPLIQTFDSELGNRNVLVVGGPGSAKTQGFVFPNVLHQTQASLCISDPKGEVFIGTAKIKEQQGFKVRILNFIDMLSSNRWNPLDYVRSEVDASMVANTIVSVKNNPEKKDIWYNGQLTLLRSLILYAIHEFEPKHRNLAGILDFLREFNDTYSEEEEGTALDRMFEALDFHHPARMSYELGYKQSVSRTRSGIMLSMLTTVGDYVSSYVQYVTNQSDFSLSSLGREKVALYLIIDADDDTWEGLVNLFIRQLFKELKRVGEENQAKLYTPVQFILDEFANLGQIPNFSKFLSTCRGYGIAVMPIIQNISQLQKNYGDKEAESIDGNCSTKIVLKASDSKTQEHFSRLLGNTTVRVRTHTDGNTHSTSESYMKRPLLDATEIQRVDRDGCLIVTDNTPPILAKKAYQSKYFVNQNGQLIQQYAIDIQNFEFKEDIEMRLIREDRERQYQDVASSPMDEMKQKAEEAQEQAQKKKMDQEEQEKVRSKEQHQKEMINKSRDYFYSEEAEDNSDRSFVAYDETNESDAEDVVTEDDAYTDQQTGEEETEDGDVPPISV